MAQRLSAAGSLYGGRAAAAPAAHLRPHRRQPAGRLIAGRPGRWVALSGVITHPAVPAAVHGAASCQRLGTAAQVGWSGGSEEAGIMSGGGSGACRLTHIGCSMAYQGLPADSLLRLISQSEPAVRRCSTHATAATLPGAAPLDAVWSGHSTVQALQRAQKPTAGCIGAELRPGAIPCRQLNVDEGSFLPYTTVHSSTFVLHTACMRFSLFPHWSPAQTARGAEGGGAGGAPRAPDTMPRPLGCRVQHVCSGMPIMITGSKSGDISGSWLVVRRVSVAGRRWARPPFPYRRAIQPA